MASVTSQLPAFLNLVRAKAERGVAAVCVASAENMEKRLSVPFPPASVAGESPHRRTGHLQGSSYAEKENFSQTQIAWSVGNDAKYAFELEYGLFGGQAFYSYNDRPFVRPTLYEFTMVKGQELFEQEMVL